MKVRRRWLLIGAALSAPAGTIAAFSIWRRAAPAADAPVVGLSADTAWHARLGLSTATYVTALTRAGARVWEFRPGDATAEQILDRVDALVLAGGFDVDPARYAGDTDRAIHPDRKRDALEIALIKGAAKRDLPLLGICRGVQILNVAHGGSLISLRRDPKLGPRHGGELGWNHSHAVSIVPGSKLSAIEGAGVKQVNSFHGQAIDRVGAKLRIAARALDGVIEGIERPDRRFMLGIQWHPEVLSLSEADELRIVERLVAAARTRR